MEALLAVPGHIVEGCQCPVCEKQVIQQAGADNDVVGLLDHVGQDLPGGWIGGITLGEKLRVAADGVGGRWGVNRFLDVRAVEVVVGAIAFGGEAELVIEEWTEIWRYVSVDIFDG